MVEPPQVRAPRIAATFLRRVSRARGTELSASLWAFVYFFALLASYYVLRPIRDEMAVEAGQERLQQLFTALFVTMLAIVPVFGALTSRFPRKRLLPWLYAFFILNLAGFRIVFAASDRQTPLIATAFFVWVSVFNLFAVSVFWSLMADLFDTAQAKRLYGFIAAGGTAGALAGPTLTAIFVTIAGVRGMLLVSAGFLAVCVLASLRLRVWAERTGAAGAVRDESPIGGSVWAGIGDLVRSPYLLGICVFLLCYSLLSTQLYFQQTALFPAAIPDSEARTRLFALLDVVVNVLALMLQVFAFSAMIQRLGTAFTLAAMPVVAIAGFIVMAFHPVLGTLVVFGVMRRAGEYAISKPARETLFNALPPAEKYKAKNVIDTLVHRSGDAASSWVFAGLKGAGMSPAAMNWIAVPIAALWLAVAVKLGWAAEARIKRGAGFSASTPPLT